MFALKCFSCACSCVLKDLISSFRGEAFVDYVEVSFGLSLCKCLVFSSIFFSN